jgi:hypothetical protein
MADVKTDTPNGLGFDAPTPDELDRAINGEAGSDDDGDLFGSGDDEQQK